jgi:hypothetical protein
MNGKFFIQAFGWRLAYLSNKGDVSIFNLQLMSAQSILDEK